MKELSIEEKAKAYDEAIVKLRGMMPNWERLSYNGKTFLQDLIHLFPELKESEDEQHSKWILEYLYDGLRKSDEQFKGQFKAAIAWLEKQGEQKSAWTPMDEQHVENLLALIEGHGYPGEVAWLNSLEDRVQPKQGEQKPAIKLERDENGEPILTPFEAGLFSMMSEAWQGYSFGEEVNLAKIVKEHSIELLERANEQKPAEWSEEDKCIYDSIIHDMLGDLALTPKQKNWLKSLKDRVGCEADCTTTKNWSEEDDVWIERACMLLSELNDLSNLTLAKIPSNVNEIIEHIKSLRPQKHWKPTGAQLASLEIACDRNDRIGFDLTQLLRDLKKLKE